MDLMVINENKIKLVTGVEGVFFHRVTIVQLSVVKGWFSWFLRWPVLRLPIEFHAINFSSLFTGSGNLLFFLQVIWILFDT